MLIQKHVTKTMSFVILSLLVLLFSCAVSADEESLPFIAILKGNADPVPTEDPCIMTNEETGGGFATHIGKLVRADSSEIVNFCSPEGIAVNGEMEIEDVNGDMLYLSYKTTAMTDPDFTEIVFYGPYRVTGGTGRFEDAEGRGTIAGYGSLLDPYEVFATLTGKLSLEEFDD